MGKKKKKRQAADPDRKQVAATIARQRRITDKLGVPQIERHVFLCAEPSKSKCCSRKAGLRAYAHLKKRLKDEGLLRAGGVYLTKANCLDVCKGGPIAVVYPDGTWYGHCDPPVLDRIVDEHLLGGRPVEEFRIAEQPLPSVVRDAGVGEDGGSKKGKKGDRKGKGKGG